MPDMTLMRATDLVKEYGPRDRRFRAVDGVSLALGEGETVGLVGESGSGKSTVARMLIRLVDPSAGEVRYRGEDITSLSARRLRPLRRNWQMVFQNPYGSLIPNLTVLENVMEPLRVNRIGTPREQRDVASDLLDAVGLARRYGGMYSRSLSGGQQQRVAIARALALQPELLVCDEPTSALDVSIQASILDLLTSLQAEHGFAMLFITHNLAVVQRVADRVVVMQKGRVVEEGPTRTVFARPAEQYTRVLLNSVLPIRG